jgi:hypothetical protein
VKFALRNSSQGSVLVITIIFCTLIGMILAAYLSMVSSQHRSSFRSQVWNECIPLCEAGIEEAMAHLNYSGTMGNFGINGWRLSDGAYRKERTLSGGTVRMAISTANPPVVTVSGSLPSPLQSNYLTRTIEAQTKRNKRFPQAIVAKGKVSLSGAAARVDSFNSTNLLQNPLGQYNPLTAGAQAIIATTSKLPGNLDIGNVSVYGYAATGPGGDVIVGVNGNIGSTLWNDNPLYNGKVEPGHYANNANLYIPDAALPTSFAPVVPGPATVDGTNYNYVFGNGDYRINTINLSSSDKILITGNARIYVETTTSVSGQAYILVANGASVEWYCGGNVSLGGGGVINAPAFAKDFSLYGLPTCTAISYSGGSKFIGTIYAPQANITMTGNNDSSGAMVGASVNISGGMSLHYDESLQAGPQGRYLISFWREL